MRIATVALLLGTTCASVLPRRDDVLSIVPEESRASELYQNLLSDWVPEKHLVKRAADPEASPQDSGSEFSGRRPWYHYKFYKKFGYYPDNAFFRRYRNLPSKEFDRRFGFPKEELYKFHGILSDGDYQDIFGTSRHAFFQRFQHLPSEEFRRRFGVSKSEFYRRFGFLTDDDFYKHFGYYPASDFFHKYGYFLPESTFRIPDEER